MTAQELHDQLARHSIQADSQELARRLRHGYSCARCGRSLRNGEWFYSRHSGRRFCTDLKKCDKRARRRSA